MFIEIRDAQYYSLIFNFLFWGVMWVFFLNIFQMILLYVLDLDEKQMDLTLEEPKPPTGKASPVYMVLSVHWRTTDKQGFRAKGGGAPPMEVLHIVCRIALMHLPLIIFYALTSIP